VNTNPKQLSTSELDTVRSDVVKRINAMPKVSKDEKDRLIEKVQTAKTLELLRVVHFDRGKATLPRNLSDELISSIHGSDMESKLSDPTTVLVVAGYADSGGDPQLNFRLSNERAEYVAKLLRQQGNILNVIHTVAMGATDLLDSKRPDQNRAVEIWAVTP
jgi:outer membrane protein OmpA-like peptidoglycan-associated protein